MNTEIKEPDWFNMSLTELVTKSMALGVVPLFKFVDKDKAPEVEEVKKKSKPPMSETPIDILQERIEYYQSFIKKLETREGIDPSAPEEKLKKIKTRLKRKIIQFNTAIFKLKN